MATDISPLSINVPDVASRWRVRISFTRATLADLAPPVAKIKRPTGAAWQLETLGRVALEYVADSTTAGLIVDRCARSTQQFSMAAHAMRDESKSPKYRIAATAPATQRRHSSVTRAARGGRRSE